MLHYAPTRFPATILRSRAIGEFVLTETRYGADAALPRHAHDYACLVAVLDGTFRESYGSAQRAGAPGMVIVRPEGEPHSNRFARAGGRCLNVELPPRWLARVRESTRVCDTSAALDSPLLGQRLLTELAAGDDLGPLAVESLVLSVLVDGARESRRAPNGPPRWLLRAKELLQDRLDARFSLAEIASEVGVHRVHLATAFRRHFGQTVASYLRQLRIEYACRALAGSNAPLADIALAAGFSDQSHFGRTFKRAMRATPAEFRAAAH